MESDLVSSEPLTEIFRTVHEVTFKPFPSLLEVERFADADVSSPSFVIGASVERIGILDGDV